MITLPWKSSVRAQCTTGCLHRWLFWRGAGYRTWVALCAWSCVPPLTWWRRTPCCRSVCCWATRTLPSTRRSTGSSTDSRCSCPVVPAPSTACFLESYACSVYPISTEMPPQLPLRQPTRLPSVRSTRDTWTWGNRNPKGSPPHTSFSSDISLFRLLWLNLLGKEASQQPEFFCLFELLYSLLVTYIRFIKKPSPVSFIL